MSAPSVSIPSPGGEGQGEVVPFPPFPGKRDPTPQLRYATQVKPLTLVLFLLSIAACGTTLADSTVTYPLVATADSIAQGATLYAEHCATCHADPVIGGERRFNAPRHDPDGHTWHHPDRPLVQWVLESPPGGSIMPAFADTLSEEEAAAIIGYIRSTWPADLQANHVELSQRWEDQVGEQ